MSRVGHGCPNPRRQLAGSRGGGRWDNAPGRGASVQPSGQGTPIENVQTRVVWKRASGGCSVVQRCTLPRSGSAASSQGQDQPSCLVVRNLSASDLKHQAPNRSPKRSACPRILAGIAVISPRHSDRTAPRERLVPRSDIGSFGENANVPIPKDGAQPFFDWTPSLQGPLDAP